MISQYLPFHNLNDDELQSLYCNFLSAVYYENLYFNPYEVCDRYNEDVSPDSFTNGDVTYNRLMSDYYDVDRFNNKVAVESTTSNFTLMAHNIRSIAKNLDEFLIDFDIAKNNIDIMAFCETRLSVDIESIYRVPNYVLFSNPRNTMGGGMAMYISDRYRGTVVEEFTFLLPQFEMITVKVNRNSEQYLLCCIYRPPHDDLRAFIEVLDTILLRLASTYSDMKRIIMGDFNINLLNVKSGGFPQEFLNTMYSFGYMPHILRPTRVAGQSATLIDNVWTSDGTLLINGGIIKSGISDHFPVFIDIVGSGTCSRFTEICYSMRIVNAECKARIATNLSEVDFDQVMGSTDVEYAYGSVVQIIDNLFNSSFPLIQRRKKKLDIDKPYIDNDIKVMIKQKHRLQRLYFKHPITYEREYKSIRNALNTKLRLAKRKFYSDRLKENSGNMKKTWRILNELCGRKNDDDRKVVLNINGVLV